jgi:hypothetical protein
MYAYIKLEGGFLEHTWPVNESVEETDEGVVIDGYCIEGATLERVESDRKFFGDEAYARHFEPDGLFVRLRRALGVA